MEQSEAVKELANITWRDNMQPNKDMPANSSEDLQQEAIKEVCDEISAFLQGKNKSYQGSAFRDIVYTGKVIKAEDTINVRIVDKIRRLQSDNPNFDGEDSELDLCGYIILKRALKKISK